MTLTSGLRPGPARGSIAAGFGFLTVATSMRPTASGQVASGDEIAVRDESERYQTMDIE
jgi:hypothetical protein